MGGIVDFVNDGGNLLFATSKGISDGLRLFAQSLGVEFDETRSSVIDHFSYEPSVDYRYVLPHKYSIDSNRTIIGDRFLLISSRSMEHTAILSSTFVGSKVILGSYLSSTPDPILYQGIGHSIESDNILAVKVTLTLKCILLCNLYLFFTLFA